MAEERPIRTAASALSARQQQLFPTIGRAASYFPDVARKPSSFPGQHAHSSPENSAPQDSPRGVDLILHPTVHMRNVSIKSSILITVISACCGVGCGDDDANGKPSGGAVGSGPSGLLDPNAAAKAAVFFGSCIPDDGINRAIENLYTNAEGGYFEKILQKGGECLKDKTNGCQAVEECLGITVDVTGPCERSCKDGVYENCDDSVKYRFDCTKIGLSCLVEQGCVEDPEPPACDYDTFKSTCKDGAPVDCFYDGLEDTGPVCAELGLTCAALPEQEEAYMACRGTGPSCSSWVGGTTFSDGIACDGANLRACVNDGEHLVDCGTVAKGFSCQSLNTASFCGLAAECEPGSAYEATCEGTTVVFCNAGRIEKIDCTTLGFTGCDTMYYGTGMCSPGPFGL